MRGRIWPAASFLACSWLGALLAVGCGSASGPRRAAEPASSPPLRSVPAGAVESIGSEPEGLAFDSGSNLLAVGLRSPDRLAFVDPRSLKVVLRVPLPAPPRHLAYSRPLGAVIVPAESADSILEVSPHRGVLARVRVGTHPHDAAAFGREVFVADEHADQVSVLRGERQIATLAAPHQPGGIASAGDFVALVAVSQRVLKAYDARSLRPLGETPAGVGPTHVATLGREAFVADTQGDAVRAFRVGPQPRPDGVVPAVGAPYGIAVDARRRRLWVTLTKSNRLVEFRLEGSTPVRVATYPTVRQPNSVEVDPRSGAVYVAGRQAGALERIAPASGEH